MTLATWNIKGVGARKKCLLRWLDERKPDVVALQEDPCEGFPEDLKSAGYHTIPCAKENPAPSR